MLCCKFRLPPNGFLSVKSHFSQVKNNNTSLAIIIKVWRITWKSYAKVSLFFYSVERWWYKKPSPHILEPRVEKLFKVNDQNDYGEPNSGTSNINDISSKINGYDNGQKKQLSSNPSSQRRNDNVDAKNRQGAETQNYQKDVDEDIIDIEISSPGKDGNNIGKKERTVEGTEEYVDSRTVGVVIGVLLTIISLLIGGILYVIYRNKRCNGLKSTSTPTHSLLTRKFTDRFSTSIDFKDMHKNI